VIKTPSIGFLFGGRVGLADPKQLYRLPSNLWPHSIEKDNLERRPSAFYRQIANLPQPVFVLKSGLSNIRKREDEI